MPELPSHARVVIVGGGMMGTGLLFASPLSPKLRHRVLSAASLSHFLDRILRRGSLIGKRSRNCASSAPSIFAG